MAQTINADDGSVSGSAGLKSSSDGTAILALQTKGTTAVTIDGSQNATFAQAANLPNTFGFKNRIINGAMVIDQRNAGASQTITGGVSTLAFNCDRWQVRSAGANATVQQVATNNTYRMVFTGAASVSAVAASQSIEVLNCVDLAGSNATLSLVAKSTSLTSLTLEAYYANTTNTFGTWGSPTVTSIGTQAVTISSTESTVSWTFAVPSAATTGIQIRITGGALGAAQTLTIGNVQLEKGSTATSFDWRSYTNELQLCQRYYAKSFSIDVAPGTSTSAGAYRSVSGGGASWVNFDFPVEMRAVPTITPYNLTGTSGVYGSDVGNWTTMGTTISTRRHSAWGNVTSGNYVYGQYVASIEL